MRVRTKAPIKKAAVLPAAGNNKLRFVPYQKSKPLSILKSEIGILLFCLQFPVGQELSQVGWELFERLLRRYVDLIIYQNARQGHPGYVESANGSKRVSG
jgi:hypothetical protein